MIVLNEKAFGEIKRRELRRFHAAVDSVIEGLLLRKYEETRKAEEYRDYARICGHIRSSLHLIDLAADKMAPLLETSGERSNWEIYLAGLRHVVRKLPESYLFKFVFPMLGLDSVREKLVAYSARWLEQFHAAHRLLRESEGYVHNLTRGYDVAQEYSVADNELPRLYASVKTWPSKEDLERFASALSDFLDLTVEAFVVGPIQLYLMLGRDGFTLIFKALTVTKLSDLRGDSREIEDVLRLHDFLNGLVTSSTTLPTVQEVLKEATKEYAKRFREEQARLRAQLPTREMRYRFVERYETGALFRTRED